MATKAKLFQYAAILHPTDEEEKLGVKSKLILDIKTILGKDDKSVAMKAITELDSQYHDKLDQVEIVVSGF